MRRVERRAGIAYTIANDNGSHTVHFIEDGWLCPPLEQRELVVRSGGTRVMRAAAAGCG